MYNYFITFIKEYSENYSGLPKFCWQGISLICINASTIGICFFLSLYFVNDKQLNISTAGLLLSCYGLGTIIGGLVGGKLSDKITPRIVSIFSLYIQSASFFFLMYLHSTSILMLDLLILGISAYSFKISNNINLLNFCVNDIDLRYRTLSISHVAANLGLGLSGIFIGGVETFGFSIIFGFSGFLLFFSATYLTLQDNIITKPAAKQNTVEEHLNKTNATKIIILILSCIFFIGLVIAQLSTTYPLYIQESFPKLNVQAVSILFLLDTALIVLFQAPLTVLVCKQNKLLITGLGALFMGLGMLILSFSFVFSLAILSCIVWTTGEMLFISTAQLICYENSSNKRKGQSLGLFQSTFAVSNVVGPWLGSFIYQYWGGNILWYCSTVIGICCFLLCWYFSRFNTNTAP
ncbi:MFS transporter [Legionella anisa]|uniref:MFS transporter n=1 Tax=Legionella anisa TaxID=28082 RepID=A0AAX0WNV0_9GAMM|nr:MFS transporter [Legionella anisa]AWN73113.1 MFS transporter [Legionella anisa]KTC67452.1 multidrug resistance protein, MFS family [Legionella anisa]MCW8423943.1 MFS transporter [Legionella anisa]MCW8447465.1 MFS transporter [Legionella anisa]PNL60231.1 MFS transporter [Legionella anisa]